MNPIHPGHSERDFSPRETFGAGRTHCSLLTLQLYEPKNIIGMGGESPEWRLTLGDPLPEEADTDPSCPGIESDGFHHLPPVSAPALSIASLSISLLWLKAAPEAALSELPSFVNSNSARHPFTLL